MGKECSSEDKNDLAASRVLSARGLPQEQISHLQQRSAAQHSGQIFSFVQRSRGVDSHALVRSQFLLILTNQVPSLCLLPRFAAKRRPFLTVLTTIPKKNIARSAMSIFIKISTEEDSPYLGP